MYYRCNNNNNNNNNNKSSLDSLKYILEQVSEHDGLLDVPTQCISFANCKKTLQCLLVSKLANDQSHDPILYQSRNSQISKSGIYTCKVNRRIQSEMAIKG